MVGVTNVKNLLKEYEDCSRQLISFDKSLIYFSSNVSIEAQQLIEVVLEGYCWHVGDGKSISVWDASWLYGDQPYIVQSPRVNGIVNMLLARCGLEAETSLHICRDCPYAALVWEQLGVRRNLSSNGEPFELELLQITYPRVSHEHTVRWQPSEAQWVKTNFDGGFYRDLPVAGVGIVIRDADGLLMGATCDWKRNILSAEAVEALATVTAIRSEISNYIWDAKHQLIDFERFKFQHIKRRGNQVAHLMAKEGFIWRRDMHGWKKVPRRSGQRWRLRNGRLVEPIHS
ncbi:hypothetical protein J1N35_034643 [Gossypium stocksii]|uniref:RNase H type-1 domain-containing protein n=1 Tax=Gossypium stocksii TaxID=47602 RepID=A0A9D3USI2_9ROSI|nr:hypothetical protein J1N35_034643 [Gossypium stocksii]